MKVGALTAAQHTSLIARLDALDARDALPPDAVGRRIPRGKRPPPTYTKGARGWSKPITEYPQSTGAVVVTMPDATWGGLNPAQQALFDDLPVDGRGRPQYPAGFNEGTVAAGARPAKVDSGRTP